MRRGSMRDISKACSLALIQAEPVMFDKDASLKKALDLILEAGKKTLILLYFPNCLSRDILLA